MKKEIYILVVFIVLILVFSLFVLKKDKKSGNNHVSNPYEKFSFYKKDNLDRYESYYLNNNYSYRDVVLRVNMNLDNSFYTNTKEVTDFNTLMLVNKYNYIAKNNKPDLVELKEYSVKDMYLNEECMINFLAMARSIEKENMNIRAMSTYRTYDYQDNLYNNYVSRDGVKNADTYSARPGFSEHHTGLAIDIDNTKTSYTNFSKTNEFKWMQDNAYKYGFILRYPKDKEDITGYMYEPWHYRYVGVAVSKYIHENNITFEEYYYEFLDK